MTLKLLNPGPVTLTARVRNALARVDLCHREPDFEAIQSEIRKRLASIYDGVAGNFTAVLLSGSGTAAVESMIGSLIAPTGARALVLANGVYGDRIKAILARQSKPFDSIDHGWTQPLDLRAIEERLKSDRSLTHVIAVHHETTTGRLNDLDAVGRLCKQYGVLLLLDAVSSFAGEELRFDDWNIGAVAATANKCLHGAPGMAFVLVKKALLAEKKTHSPSLYLDLWTQYEAQERGGSAFTQATHVCVALLEALRELEDEGGWRARHERYRSLSEQVRLGLEKQGILTYLGSPPDYSAILTSFRLPLGMTYESLHDYLRDNGFVIYAGQGNFKTEMFRLSYMGDLTSSDMSRLLGLFERLPCA